MTELETSLAEPLIDALRTVQGPVLVVSGAGISAASGISTFRGSEPDAVWRRYDVDMATVATFHRDPGAQLSWYFERFAALATARPNAGHLALARLEPWIEARGNRFLLVTQNIDTLHEQAGSRRLIKVHGTADRLRCGRPGCPLGAPEGSIPIDQVDVAGFRERPEPSRLPRCPRCSSPLRAHVLFFDEYYDDHRDYRFDEVEAAAETAALILFVGTSFAVGVTSLMVQAGSRRRLPMFSIDPNDARLPAVVPMHRIAAPAESLLPIVLEGLGDGPGEGDGG